MGIEPAAFDCLVGGEGGGVGGGSGSGSEGEVAVLGAKRAAVRKLGHELGIPAEQLPLEELCFLTKVSLPVL